MRARAINVAVSVALFIGLGYLEFSSAKRPLPPSLPAVTTCKELKPGMRRIGEQVGFQFDVPIKDFTILEGWTDAPPPTHGFDIRPKNSTADLSISWRGQTTRIRPPNPILDSSDNIKKRGVLDDNRKLIGEESRGYWGQSERWRRVHLLGSVEARYGSTNEKDVPSYGSVHELDAALLDQIINSACRSPSTAE